MYHDDLGGGGRLTCFYWASMHYCTCRVLFDNGTVKDVVCNSFGGMCCFQIVYSSIYLWSAHNGLSDVNCVLSAGVLFFFMYPGGTKLLLACDSQDRARM